MSLPDFRFALQRLCDGVTSRDSLDNPALSLTQIFVEIALAFNNEEIVVHLPDEFYDLEYILLLDPNDDDRIVIQRDPKLFVIHYLCFIPIHYILTFISLFYIAIQTNGQSTYGRQH